MTLNEQCMFSYYVPVAPINEEHGVYLVRHTETGAFFVRKTMRYYNISVFQNLKAKPIDGMPKIFEVMEDNGVLHIIEEYISGNTLERLLQTEGPFNETLVADWAHQLCLIVRALHQCTPPIIHRDIKPNNIILAYDGRIKLLDLSAARQSDDSKAQDTVLMGTAGYAAPEQYGFSTSSEATDIYAIGVLMNKLLTGNLLSERVYSGTLSRIIGKCTRLEPCDRFSDISHLDIALCRYLHIESQNQRLAWRSYLPPGFRSGRIPTMFFAALAYFLLLSMTFSITIKEADSRLLWANRIGITIAFLGVIFISGNYLGCQSYLPLSRNSNPVIRFFGVVLWDVVFFILCVCVLVTFEM